MSPLYPPLDSVPVKSLPAICATAHNDGVEPLILVMFKPNVIFREGLLSSSLFFKGVVLDLFPVPVIQSLISSY